jgi:EF-P beta-lysylation protein EpmB
MRVPRSWVARIRPGDARDPLLLQVLPTAQERVPTPRFSTDPLAESRAGWGPGLLRKYQNRILMVAAGRCGVHCRFCFRRHFPFASACPTPEAWDAALEQIAADPSVHEVILSGGDPLVLDDADLGQLARRLAEIPHLRRLRIHTRLPILVPRRVDGPLLRWLRATRLTPIVVVHVNHPAEIDDEVAAALARLVEAGIPVLGQAVLLRGVNDRLDVLEALCERLVDLRVMPYYLHQLDRVAGAAHFEVPESTGAELIGRLRARLPGYAVFRYVRETPGAPNKVVLA